MSEEEYPTAWDDIQTYDPPTGSGSVEGTGVSEDLTVVKAAALVGQQLAVLGYEIRPSQFEENSYYAQIEVMDAAGDKMLVRMGGPAIIDHSKYRHQNGQIPFKTVLDSQDNKSGTRTYYVFR